MTKRFNIEIIGEKDVFIKEEGANYFLGVNEYVNAGAICSLLNELNDENEQLKHNATVLIYSNQEYRKENEKLKQFQERVAEVINGKMGDNVCNGYKMEILKEIWNELDLDEVWFK